MSSRTGVCAEVDRFNPFRFPTLILSGGDGNLSLNRVRGNCTSLATILLPSFIGDRHKEAKTMNTRFYAVMFSLLFMTLNIVPAAAQESVFPVTIEHKFGSTIITEQPQRVVAIGYTEQDLLLALGVTPVAVRYWYGEEDAILPWTEDRVEDEAPIVLNMPFGNLNYEAILDLQPDLISAVTSGITQEEYDLLSQIAPTIAQSGDYIDFGMLWQEATQMVGDAVGKSAEAAEVVAAVEALFEQARAEYPEFEGKTVAVAYFNAGTYGFYSSQDIRGRFFTELGFVIPEEMDEIAGESFYADVSAERIDLLDQDLIAILNLQFIEGGREALEAEPLFSQLTAAQEGRVIYFDEQAENALGFSSPLSLPYALNAALPQLEAIFGTSVVETTCEAGFRLFEHELLATEPVCVPENPQRVAFLDQAVVNGYVLGVNSVTRNIYLDYFLEDFPDIFSEDTLSVMTDLGYIAETNPEALLNAQPDLIVSATWWTEANEYAVDIAPTVIFNYEQLADWRDGFQAVAALFQREEEGEAILADIDARIDILREFVATDETPQTFSVLRTTGEAGQLQVFTTQNFGAQHLVAAGLVMPEGVLTPNEAAEVRNAYNYFLSTEVLPVVDADYILRLM
jgi:iron complex transport system substrate-binding protein